MNAQDQKILTKKSEITLEELERQSCNVLPSREEMVVIDTGFSNPSFMTAMDSPYSYGNNHTYPTQSYPSYQFPVNQHMPVPPDDCDWKSNDWGHGNRQIDYPWNQWDRGGHNYWDSQPRQIWEEPPTMWQQQPSWGAPITAQPWSTPGWDSNQIWSGNYGQTMVPGQTYLANGPMQY